MNSVLTSHPNDLYENCSYLDGLSNTVYRLSPRCFVFEILIRARQGHFHTTTDREGRRGGYYFTTPQNSGITGTIYKTQAAFDRSGKFKGGNLKSLTSGSPMTSQVRSNPRCLTISRIWYCCALQPYQMEISQYNNTDRIWETSKYHSKLSVSILKVKVIQGHEVKERSN